MKTKLEKKLTLNRERIRELTDSQLEQAAGQKTNSIPDGCICATNTATTCPTITSQTDCC